MPAGAFSVRALSVSAVSFLVLCGYVMSRPCPCTGIRPIGESHGPPPTTPLSFLGVGGLLVPDVHWNPF
ncbi:hypothetical protein GCM10018773_05270 [Streptomyces candidus]|nr:hypothetical protein GCM10018773_05270 [Streptomyces candidus]